MALGSAKLAVAKDAAESVIERVVDEAGIEVSVGSICIA